jgi:hypothetical protein
MRWIDGAKCAEHETDDDENDSVRHLRAPYHHRDSSRDAKQNHECAQCRHGGAGECRSRAVAARVDR